MNDFIGKIKTIRGNIVEVEFTEEKPQIHDLLVIADDPTIVLEVSTSASRSSFYCFALTDPDRPYRGAKVVNTRKSIQIPVGPEVLGRVMNLFGQPVDEKGPIQTKEIKSIYSQVASFDKTVLAKELVETGIKAIDFFSPIL